MKKQRTICLFVLIFVIALSFTVGCMTTTGKNAGTGNETDISDNNGESGSEEKEDVVFTVIFDSAGGSEVAPVTVESGGKIPEPTPPKKATLEKQYSFRGWYFEGEKWDFINDTVTENITLTAKWELTGDFTVGF